MDDCPGEVDQKQLVDLCLTIRQPPKKDGEETKG